MGIKELTFTLDVRNLRELEHDEPECRNKLVVNIYVIRMAETLQLLYMLLAFCSIILKHCTTPIRIQ